MSNIVPAEGPIDADIMIIGEAPGAHEAQTGKPFMGPSGQLLTTILHKVGIQRSTCYITNVIKERPLSNNIKLFLDLSKRNPIETPAYYEYLDILQQEIKEVDPNVIVVCGNTPLWALCSIRGITKYRGSILESTLVPGKKVIPIIHPAAALRVYEQQHLIRYDLIKVKANADSAEIGLKERSYITGPSFSDSIAYLEECQKSPLVAFDIEVYNTEVSCISFSYSADHAISIPFLSGTGDYFNPEQEADIWQAITDVLEDTEIECVGQNTTFDATFLFRKYGIRVSNIHDTMVAMGIIFPDFSKSLATITSIFTDIPYYKDDGKRAIKGKAVPSYQFWEYNAKDSIVLMEALPKMLSLLEQQGNLEVYKTQCSLIPALTFMTERGIRMDTVGLDEKTQDNITDIAIIEKDFTDIAGNINPRSPAQLKELFYKKKKARPYTKKGSVTVDEKALKRLSALGHKEAELLLKHRRVTKLTSTYFDMTLDEDGRLRCSMNPIGTETLRLASSRTIFGTGANMQNQPHEMKRYMLVDTGHIAYNVDLEQAENRIVAYIAPDMLMIRAFENNEDIHSLTASFITPAFGISLSPEEIARQDKLFEAGDRQYAAPIGKEDHSWRFWGKRSNHAFNYGLGPGRFSLDCEIPRAEGQKIFDRYHAAYPGVHRMHSHVQQQLRKTMSMRDLFGHSRRYYTRWSDELFKAAYALVPQGTVAGIINRRGVLYLYNNQDLFKGVYLLNQVHDSIVFSIPISYGYEYHATTLKLLKESLEQPLSVNNSSFIIPAAFKMSVNNFLQAKDLDVTADTLAGQVEENHLRMQTS